MFTTAHLHLLINHAPIIVPILGLLLLAWGWLRHSDVVARMGLVFVVGGALSALPTYLAGHGASQAVKGAPGVTPALVHQHSQAAFTSSLVLGAVGVFAVWALWRYRAPIAIPRWALGAATGGTVVASGMMAWVGLLGGAIRHTEVREDPPAAFGVGATPAGAPAGSAAGAGPATAQAR